MSRARKEGSLKRRMSFLLLLTFIPMIVVISVLFFETMESQQRTATEALHYTVQQMNGNLEKLVSNVYSVSDSFSTDERLLGVIDKDYQDKAIEKRRVTAFILNTLFESYNRLQPQERMDAVYVVPRDELFNFIDPNQDDALVLSKLRALGADEKEKLGRFFWYGLQPNFLKTARYEMPRRDNVVIGSRRVYSAVRNSYPYIHVFAVEEATLYEQYDLLAKSVGAQVYILDADNNLISSTDEDAVAQCRPPDALLQLMNTWREGEPTGVFRGEQHTVSVVHSNLSGWRTIALIPAAQATQATRDLFAKILWVLILCTVVCVGLLLYLYRLFMEPLSALASSIKAVDSGNLQAYVKPQGEAEMARMMRRYNAMLDSIQRNMDETVKMEADKKDLEMQVLMSQINPHFLYNTLETIVWRAGDVGRPDIGKIAASLGKLYRLSISGGLFVPLAQELAHVNAYVNIQQSRYGEHILYQTRCRGVDADALIVLKLMLQPIVENCFLYALEGVEHPVRIRVTAQVRAGYLLLHVSDNGGGMCKETLAQVRMQMQDGRKEETSASKRRSTGIGLHNIYARLKLYAGADSDLRIMSRLGWGTRVTVKLPVQTTPTSPS